GGHRRTVLVSHLPADRVQRPAAAPAGSQQSQGDQGPGVPEARSPTPRGHGPTKHDPPPGSGENRRHQKSGMGLPSAGLASKPGIVPLVSVGMPRTAPSRNTN